MRTGHYCPVIGKEASDALSCCEAASMRTGHYCPVIGDFGFQAVQPRRHASMRTGHYCPVIASGVGPAWVGASQRFNEDRALLPGDRRVRPGLRRENRGASMRTGHYCPVIAHRRRWKR